MVTFGKDNKGNTVMKHPYCYGFKQGKKLVCDLNFDGLMTLSACLERSFPEIYKPEVIKQEVNTSAGRESPHGIIGGVFAEVQVKNGTEVGWGCAWEGYTDNKFAVQNAITKATRNAYKKIIPVLLRTVALEKCLDTKLIKAKMKDIEIETLLADGDEQQRPTLTNAEQVQDEMIDIVDKQVRKLNKREDIVKLWSGYKKTHSHDAPQIKEAVLEKINRRADYATLSSNKECMKTLQFPVLNARSSSGAITHAKNFSHQIWKKWTSSRNKFGEVDEAGFIAKLYDDLDLLNSKAAPYILVGNRVDDLANGVIQPETDAEKYLVNEAAKLIDKYRVHKQEGFISCDFVTEVDGEAVKFQAWGKPDMSNGNGTVRGDFKTMYRKQVGLDFGDDDEDWNKKKRTKRRDTEKQLWFYSVFNYINGAGILPEYLFMALVESGGDPNSGELYITNGDIEEIQIDIPTQDEMIALQNDIVTELPKMYAVAKRAYDFKIERQEMPTTNPDDIPF